MSLPVNHLTVTNCNASAGAKMKTFIYKKTKIKKSPKMKTTLKTRLSSIESQPKKVVVVVWVVVILVGVVVFVVIVFGHRNFKVWSKLG